MFGEPGHPALERVAMEVGKARNCDAGDMVGPGGSAASGDRDNDPIDHRNPNVPGPAGRQESVIEKELAPQIAFSTLAGFAAASDCSTIGGVAQISIEF
jgi:hypothetical protein